jgi:hypothetical protein
MTNKYLIALGLEDEPDRPVARFDASSYGNPIKTIESLSTEVMVPTCIKK